MAARKLEKVELETALKVVPHFPIWLVPKKKADLFKRSVEDLSSRQPEHSSPKIQPVAPDIDTLEDDSLFNDDSIDDEFIPVVLDRGHEEEGQLNQDDSNQVASRRFLAALLQSAIAKLVSSGIFGIVASRSRKSSRGVSPIPTEPQASKPDASFNRSYNSATTCYKAPQLRKFPRQGPKHTVSGRSYDLYSRSHAPYDRFPLPLTKVYDPSSLLPSCLLCPSSRCPALPL